MMLRTRVVLFVLSVMLTNHVYARSDIPIEDNASFLVSACREVVDIYDKRGEAKLLAGQRTSLSEGIKAGYCMGMTLQYSKQSISCDYHTRSWFEMAEKIANSDLTESELKWKSTESILKAAYCGF